VIWLSLGPNSQVGTTPERDGVDEQEISPS